ncbi:hypothetical protein HLB23_27660 [Nocardia uniformis]|uniref:Uncharacterized protein n=1 Tax=Nocardia uniformis TaxID=53432 RepID=A0A849CBE0_9NOCA|nr:hypothetical protein [Nocardia uniformis]NNH73585.1 hypothetical protein [Nocardia uniformis]
MDQPAEVVICRATRRDIDEMVRLVTVAFAEDDPIAEIEFPGASVGTGPEMNVVAREPVWSVAS